MNFFDWLTKPQVFWKILLTAIFGTFVFTFTILVIKRDEAKSPTVMEINNAKARKSRGAIIETNLGEIEISYRNPSSKGAEVFSLLTREGMYNGTRIHRVVNEFLMEGGDPWSRDLSKKAEWGRGELQFTFPDEIIPESKMVRGVVAFENSGHNTNGSVFFILAADAPFLDGDYTILGDVIRGMEVVDKITKQKTGVTGLPKKDIVVSQISVVEEME